jgi:hypothetical protein
LYQCEIYSHSFWRGGGDYNMNLEKLTCRGASRFTFLTDIINVTKRTKAQTFGTCRMCDEYILVWNLLRNMDIKTKAFVNNEPSCPICSMWFSNAVRITWNSSARTCFCVHFKNKLTLHRNTSHMMKIQRSSHLISLIPHESRSIILWSIRVSQYRRYLFSVTGEWYLTRINSVHEFCCMKTSDAQQFD